jgi:hypothetical protein
VLSCFEGLDFATDAHEDFVDNSSATDV